MKYPLLFSTLILLLLFTSCQKDEFLDSSILIQDDSAIITATESEEFITIRVESLSDITDNRKGSSNMTDYCNISFDINNNQKIDAEIDFGYESATENYDICSYYFLDNDAITHCGGHTTSAIFSDNFASSSRNSTPHMIWELKISKEELSFNRSLSFTVKTIDGGLFWTYPPIGKNANPIQFTFNESLTFKW